MTLPSDRNLALELTPEQTAYLANILRYANEIKWAPAHTALIRDLLRLIEGEGA